VRAILLFIPIALVAQDHPLASLPYTPSPTFAVTVGEFRA
jgi:hypothetical protein